MIDCGRFVARSLFTVIALCLAACDPSPRPGSVLDEPRKAGRGAETFKAADEDYFHDMDGAIALSPAEIQGRNTWIVWTGGNDKLWDTLSSASVGNLDFLKTLSSHPSPRMSHFSRDNRWRYLGLVNEPCFEKATGPDPKRFNLWLDKRRADCPPDPFEDETKYPGVQVGARGKTVPVGSFYGYATGIVGLRLFPNPDFDEEAAKKWDAERYYTDPSYYKSKELVRPYRVGMSCAFCHVGPNPVKPPADAEHPAWANLSSNVGAQYFWIDRIFVWEKDHSSFVWQFFNTMRPGALDTSLVSTDNINNPRTMNAIYGLLPRLQQAKRWGHEQLAGGALNSRQFNDYVKEGLLTELYQAPDTVWSPRVLKDGSDSIGALGALNRVYLNIGLFSEEWLLHFHALIGGKPTTPIEIATARKNSAYWEATEQQTPAMALFFLKSTAPHKLKDAPGGDKYLTRDAEVLKRGKVVFAENCARCHSSKLPQPAEGLDPNGCSGRDYFVPFDEAARSGRQGCFNRYWAWTRTEEFKSRMRDIVLADDFLEGNFLSSEVRIPVTLLHTNACSPLATNAIGDNIWDNFSSKTYKELPSVGRIRVYHPYTGEPYYYTMPAGGRGYTRPASLISLWSTAPFLLNNTVGRFEESPAVDARMRSFDDSIEKMLWPEKRERDSLLGDKVPGTIDRTSETTYIRVANGYLPGAVKDLLGPIDFAAPSVVGKDGIQIGPIPKGTPVNLLANLNLLSENPNGLHRFAENVTAFNFVIRAKHDLEALPRDATEQDAKRVFGDLVQPLLELSKCPDFVVNRGHYFGTGYREPGDDGPAPEPGLADADKRALIEFLKTF